MIELLTALCFRNAQQLAFVDLVFVYGTSFFQEEVASILYRLIDQGLTNAILFTGGIWPEGNPEAGPKSQARLIYEKVPNVPKNIQIYLEESSQNTLENVMKGIQAFDFTHENKIGFIFPAHAAQRGYLTLRKFLPKTEILQFSYDACYPSSNCLLSKEKWHVLDFGRRRVWGEFLRIKEYGQCGDIAYQEIENLVKEIEMSLLS